MLLYGVSAVLVGPTLPGMIATFGLTLGKAGLIGAMQNVGGLLGALLTLWIADRVSHPKAVVASYLLLAVALFAVGMSGSYLLLLTAFAATGLFIRILDVMLNAHTGDIAGEGSGRQLSTLHMFFSIGAFAGPMAARAILSAGLGWSEVYSYVGVGYVVVAVAAIAWLKAYVRVERRTSRRSGEPGHERPGAEMAEPAIVPPKAWSLRAFLAVGTIGLAMFFYAVHQVGLTSWVPYFLEETRGAGANSASFGLSAYWVGIIVGRFLVSRIVDRFGTAPILITGCIASAGATLGAVLVTPVLPAQGLLVLAGITSGATIPLAYSFGFTFLPERTGGVTALIALVMLLGRVLGPWSIGVVGDRSGLIAAMTIPAGALLFSALLVGIVYAAGRKPA